LTRQNVPVRRSSILLIFERDQLRPIWTVSEEVCAVPHLGGSYMVAARELDAETFAAWFTAHVGQSARRPRGTALGLQDVRDLCALYNVMELAREARRQGWWTQYYTPGEWVYLRGTQEVGTTLAQVRGRSAGGTG
jgi:hypothetical protein